MRAPHQERYGPSSRDSQARLGAVKTPRAARPRLCRADGLDRASGEPQMASIDGPPDPWRSPGRRPSHEAAIPVTIGQETRICLAHITSAPSSLYAPSAITLQGSTFHDLVGLALDDPPMDGAMNRLPRV